MKTVLLLLTAFICLSSFGQDKSKEDMFPEMSRAAGVSFQKFDGLNGRIAGFPQLKELRNATGVLQLGWFNEHKQFVSQINLMAGSSMSGDRDKRSSTIRYLGVGAEIGYDVIKDEKIALFPLAGLGYQRYQARFFRDNSSVNFNDILQNPTLQNNIRSLDFVNGFFNYSLGVGVAARSLKHHYSVGISVKYIASFKDHAWRSNQDQALANAPVDKLSQIYAGLVFTCRPFFMMKRGHM